MASASINKIRLSRTSTPRSKGGCITCKNRRLKCDEGKPACIRCIKTNLVCAGYVPPNKLHRQDDRGSLRLRVLKPKASRPSPQLQITASSLRFMAPSSIYLGESEIDNRYFRHFQQTAAMGLDGAWGWYLWNQVMLQNSHQESFIWHSIIAIGALLKSYDTAYAMGLHPHSVIVPEKAKLHQDFAMLKYDKAVKLLQKAVCGGTANPRQALFGCIFIVSFEMLVGNRHLAIKHAQSGILMLQEWRAQKFALEKTQPPLLSPAPLTVEDEIVEAIQNLDIQITTLMDDRSLAHHAEMMNDYCITIETLPATFASIREAQIYLNLVVRRICHFIAMAQSSSESIALTKKFDSERPGQISSITSMDIYSTPYFKVTEAVRTQQVQFATEIANWMRAFAPLFEKLCAKREDEEAPFNCAYNAAAMMQMQAIATTILTAGIVIRNEMEYDMFNPQFRALVDLAIVVVKLRQQRKKENTWAGSFWIDIGITPQLFVVVTRCRDPVIRRRAIKLLEGWYIESSWDPRLIAQIGLFIMGVEEESVVDIDCVGGNEVIIPEAARAVFSRISEDSGKGWVLMQCVLKNGGVDGGPVWKEKFIKW
ncbi:hypothetical protein DL95DRAFT_394046 [Leptodontidium sp. 2 PMI_412]|nr:hypothetical protein DL95DRAFT_394046 [Leptodontidium sp. 2 PMI_412]